MDYKVKGTGRAKKLAGREKFRQNPVNGVAMKRLLVERAAKARRTPAEQFEVETRPKGSVDKNHGKFGHLCSTLCGASMLAGNLVIR